MKKNIHVIMSNYSRVLLATFALFLSGQVFSQKPNLMTQSATFTLDQNKTGGYVKVVVTNTGPVTNGDFKVGIYISNDSNITTGDSMFNESELWGIPKGDSLTASFTIRSFPRMPDGDYYIGYIIDHTDAVDESNEEDNVGFFRDVVTFSTMSASVVSKTSLKTYPNPTNGKFTIDIGQVRHVNRVTMYNAQGKEVLQKLDVSSDRIDIDASGFATGIYRLVAYHEEGIVQTRVIVQ